MFFGHKYKMLDGDLRNIQDYVYGDFEWCWEMQASLSA